MNKNEFLNELKKHLAVLDEGEQQDILEEYAQHIGMKISAGLSEEDAIRDFGNVKELAAQILEAYHVNPKYRNQRQENLARESKKAWARFKEFAGASARAAASFLGNLFLKIKAAAGRLRRSVKAALDAGRKRETAIKERTSAAETVKELKEPLPNPVQRDVKAFHGAGHLLEKSLRALGRIFLQAARLAWNLLVLLAALMSGFCTLCLLFCLAVLLVWLAQGFTLVGAALVCVGGVLCFGGFTVLMITLISRKKRNTAAVGKEAQNA